MYPQCSQRRSLSAGGGARKLMVTEYSTREMPDSFEQPGPDPSGSRVLIFIVSYEASRHIVSTLDRIPAELLESDLVDILVIDDASKDSTASQAHDWAMKRNFHRLTVLRNPVNQGYGGNQKLGYRLAVDHCYDFVILLHGDGQYAPELLPTFIKTWREHDADVVLGTRMDSIKSARAGGMPWYKVIGNRLLTWMQNKLTGQNLTEYHTGYRGYSTRFLRAVPFEANTNQFHFDTDILLQAFHIKAKIQQFPIPTHYGDEICRVDGTRYAKDVMFATVQYRLHQIGLLCSLKFRNLLPMRYRDKTAATYSAHRLALQQIAALRPATMVDLGDAPAAVKEQIRALGVDLRSIEMVRHASVDAFDFDSVLLLDVLEDQAEPEEFLIGLRNDSRATHAIRRPPALILTTPNIAFWAIRMNLLLGRFSYAERGILHVNHKRLFTQRSLRRSLRECGYVVERFIGVGVPFEAVLGSGFVGRSLDRVAGWLAWLWPPLFAFQFLVVARPLPGIRQLLAQSERHLDGAASPARLEPDDGTVAGPAPTGGASTIA